MALAHMQGIFSVFGLQPGASRQSVFATLGRPMSDGWDGQVSSAIPVLPIENAPVWVYRDDFCGLKLVVIFKDDAVEELLANRLEMNEVIILQPGEKYCDGCLDALSRRFAASPEGLFFELSSRGLSTHPAQRFQIRLRTVEGRPGVFSGGPFLRERLATENGMSGWQVFPHPKVANALFTARPFQSDPLLASVAIGEYETLLRFTPRRCR